jgi:DNA-directed RNA polymerase specialized sigma24 family protein
MQLLEKSINVSAASQEKFFAGLYETTFPTFARFAARMNASFEDARDIFHDALVIYYEKNADADFVLRTKPEAYILGIAKHLWIRKFKDDSHTISLDSLESRITLPDDYFPTVNETRLLGFLERSGKKCLDLLRKFYYQKVALRDIAADLGYSSVRSATVQKFKCIGKIREAIKSKLASYEDFVS